jgi:DNA anti-recombination protein RmuC
VFEDSNENGFSEHVKTQHNIRDYLSFMIHLEETDEFDYTPAEKYVAAKLNSRSIATEKWFDWFPQRQAMVLRKSATARSAMVTSFMDVAQRMESLEEGQQRLAENLQHVVESQHQLAEKQQLLAAELRTELRTELRRLASAMEGGDRRVTAIEGEDWRASHSQSYL